MFKKLGNIYNHIEEIFLVACLAIMVAVIFAQVVMRYAFNNSLSWSEELARYLFVWVSWMGISFGQKKGEHITITMLEDKLKGKAKIGLRVIGNILTLAILAVLLIYGVKVTDKIFGMHTVTAALHIPKWTMYLSVPLSCFLMAARVLKKMILEIKGAVKGEVA
jgi:TRAP-type C4-dicarboxylate transport system permease small subunit